MSLELYNYKAEVLRVIDGDTIEVRVSLGFDTYTKKTVRLYGIDTPETRTKDLEEKERGFAAKEFLIEILNENNNELLIKSHGIGKFGRCLGELFVETLGTTSANQTLINEGHAIEYFGK